MQKIIFLFFQYLLPQRFLSFLSQVLAESTTTWLKNFLIKFFNRRYHVDMSEAEIENIKDYPTFNSFFIRHLKSNLRPIAPEPYSIVSPVDGCIMQIGSIKKQQLLQAKNHYFDLISLLAGEKELVQIFNEGLFTTLYLAPNNYHRVHMPFPGTLEKTIYVPGKLFSVNPTSIEYIPSLYSKNERLITVFHTTIGKMVVILIGAMIVGHIQTSWLPKVIREKKATVLSNNPIHLNKGQELGLFKMGSTVILLFEKDKIIWQPSLTPLASICFGQAVATAKNSVVR